MQITHSNPAMTMGPLLAVRCQWALKDIDRLAASFKADVLEATFN